MRIVIDGYDYGDYGTLNLDTGGGAVVTQDGHDRIKAFIGGREIGYAEVQGNVTATNNSSGASFTAPGPLQYPVPFGNRPVMLVAYCGAASNATAGQNAGLYLFDQTLNDTLGQTLVTSATAGAKLQVIAFKRYNPGPGTRVIEVRGGVGAFGSGTATFFAGNGLAGAFAPMFISALEL